jgi:hypothetical protein
MLQFKEQVKYFDKNVPGMSQMGMQFMALGTTDELKRQIVDLTFERACLTEPLPTTPEAFKARCGEAKARLGLIMQEVCRLVGTVLTEWQAVTKKLPAFKAQAAVVADIEAQLKRLMGKNFVVATPFERLQHPRYLKAVGVRLDKLKANPARDAQSMADYAAMDQLRAPRPATGQDGRLDPQVEQFRWLLEELRVGLFAQELRTPVPVSVKRLEKQWEESSMGDVMLALARTFASLREGKVWLYVLTPALFSAALHRAGRLGAGRRAADDGLPADDPARRLGAGLAGQYPGLPGRLDGDLRHRYLTASLLAAIVIHAADAQASVGQRVPRRGGDGQGQLRGGGHEQPGCLGVFIVAWVATIPLWLIPGFSLLIPLLLMGWLNRRTFAYDALSMHASAGEWQAIRSGQKTPLFMLGLTMALLAHIPSSACWCRRWPRYHSSITGWKPCAAAVAARWSLSRRTGMSRTFGAIIIGDEICPASGRTSISPRSPKCSARVACA